MDSKRQASLWGLLILMSAAAPAVAACGTAKAAGIDPLCGLRLVAGGLAAAILGFGLVRAGMFWLSQRLLTGRATMPSPTVIMLYGMTVGWIFVWSSAGAQTSAVERVFDLTTPETARQIEEIATTMHAITDIQEISSDVQRKRITVRGTGDQIRLAEFLVRELDRSAPETSAAAREFRLPGEAADVVRIFYLGHMRTPQELQEAVVMIRSMSGMTHAFVNNKLKAAILRGNGDQIALAAWLVSELNKPARELAEPTSKAGETHEYKLPEGEAVRLFYLVNCFTTERLQQIAVAVRSQGDVQRLFSNNPQVAIGARATIDLLDRAEQIVREMDK